MSNFINKIVKYILEKRKDKLAKTITKVRSAASSTRLHVTATETLTLSAETEKALETMDVEVKNIVKACMTNPDELLKFIEKHGTPVYKIPYADKILNKIDEEEGFIIPFKGMKALYLNFWIGLLAEKKLKLSFTTKAMFVLRDMEINIYYMLHQFHKWYGFKKDLPGFDELSQTLFKENLNDFSDSNYKEMTIEEIQALKDAIARDAQAAEFVIQLAKESTGAKKALEKIKKDGSAEV